MRSVEITPVGYKVVPRRYVAAVQRPRLALLAIAAGILLIVVATTTTDGHRYWPWLALLALCGRAAIAVYAIVTRRRRG